MSQNDDEVGYKKPPKRTQFKKGQSGNPNGRPKHSLNMKTILKHELESQITITESGQTMTISKAEALVKSALAYGLKGNMRALDIILKHTVEPKPQEITQEQKNIILREALAFLYDPVTGKPLPGLGDEDDEENDEAPGE